MRKTAAVAALIALIAATLTMRPSGIPGEPDLRLAFLPLLIPALAAAAGIVSGAPWGRWLGLSGGVAILPWTLALLSTPSFGQPRTRTWAVLFAAGTLVLSLAGRGAFARFEGRRSGHEWDGRALTLVRWTLIANTAAMFNLFVFATVYSPAAAWQSAIPGGLAVGLMAGVGLLARRQTAGLLVLLVSCLLLPPAALYYVFSQPATSAERGLFLILLAPGWLIATITLGAFAIPARRFMRD